MAIPLTVKQESTTCAKEPKPPTFTPSLVEPRKRLRLDADLPLEERNKRLLLENRRLRKEMSVLRKQIEQVTGGLRPSDMPIVVKKALNMAGFWNVHPNDVLIITRKLAEAFEVETGLCPVQQDGITVCFPRGERGRVVDLVVRLMPQVLPKYRRNV